MNRKNTFQSASCKYTNTRKVKDTTQTSKNIKSGAISCLFIEWPTLTSVKVTKGNKLARVKLPFIKYNLMVNFNHIVVELTE